MSDALLPCPTMFSNLLNVFTSCFTKPQFKNFCNFTNCVVLSQYSSIKRFASLGGVHQSTLNDFLTVSPWDVFQVKNRLSRFIIKLFPVACMEIIVDIMINKPYEKKMSFEIYF